MIGLSLGFDCSKLMQYGTQKEEKKTMQTYRNSSRDSEKGHYGSRRFSPRSILIGLGILILHAFRLPLEI